MILYSQQTKSDLEIYIKSNYAPEENNVLQRPARSLG